MEGSNSERIYTAETRFKHPGQLFREMILDVKSCGNLAWRLLVRNTRSQYRQFFLGQIWSLIPTISGAILATLANRTGMLKVGETTLPYPAFVLLGLLLWQTMVAALNAPIEAISQERTMLRNQNVPAEGLILAETGGVLFYFGLKFLIVMVLLLCFQAPIRWTILLIPIPLLSLVIFATSIGLFLAPFNLIYRDVSKGVMFLSGFWLFLTPIIYPKPHHGLISYLVAINPATPLIVTIRELVAGERLTLLPEFVLVSFLSVLALLLAWIVFRISMPYAVERMT